MAEAGSSLVSILMASIEEQPMELSFQVRSLLRRFYNQKSKRAITEIYDYSFTSFDHNSSKSVLVFPFFLYVFITSEEDNKDYLAISVKFNNKIIGL